MASGFGRPGNVTPLPNYSPHSTAGLTKAAASKGTPYRLAPTGGKTPAPKAAPHDLPLPGPTGVKAKAKPPVVKPAPAKRTPPKPVALTPQQFAAQQVNNSLAPLYAQAKSQADYQNSAITNYTKAIIQQLQGLPGQVGSSYDSAIGQQTNLANAAADSLRAANPNTQDQALLSAINAPDSQHAAIAGQNNATFNGGAAVGQYINGVLPMGALQAQKLGAIQEASMQPGIEALRGQQSLAGALYQQGQERGKIGAQAPDLVQKYLADFATQKARNTQLRIEYAATVAKGNKESFDEWYKKQTLGIRKTEVNNRVAEFNARQKASVAKYNATQTDKANKINVSVTKSSNSKVWLNSQGQPVMVNGKPVPYSPKSSDVKPVKLYPDLGKTQVVKLRKGMNALRFGTTTVDKVVDKQGKTTWKKTWHPPFSYQDAISHAVAEGYSRADATRMANRFYPPDLRRPAKPTPDRGFRDAKLK